MAITDELRKWAQICGIKYDSKLYEIADHIDAAHRSALEKLAAQLDESEDGWVRLPVDADGVPIHVGDVMDSGNNVACEMQGVGTVICLQYRDNSGDGTCDEMSVMLHRGHIEFGWFNVDKLRHHRAQTVEDVLCQFAREIDADAYGITDAKVAEFAAKLRLAERVEQ